MQLLLRNSARSPGRDSHPGHYVLRITQLVSKAAQRLIAEMRRKVQAHIGHLPVSYYDSNKTGTLVARIMTDVDGIRNLLGTGLIEFVGGLLTAVLVLGFLIRISWLLTSIALVIIVVFAGALQRAFTTIRPIFRERGKINAEVTGRLTESLGGVRVVKGYHAEAREEAVFGQGVQRLLDNVLKSLTATSFMSLSATVLMGIVGAMIMYVGAHQITNGVHDTGRLHDFHRAAGFPDRAHVPNRRHRHAAQRSPGRPGAHARSSARTPRRSRSPPHCCTASHQR